VNEAIRRALVRDPVWRHRSAGAFAAAVAAGMTEAPRDEVDTADLARDVPIHPQAPTTRLAPLASGAGLLALIAVAVIGARALRHTPLADKLVDLGSRPPTAGGVDAKITTPADSAAIAEANASAAAAYSSQDTAQRSAVAEPVGTRDPARRRPGSGPSAGGRPSGTVAATGARNAADSVAVAPAVGGGLLIVRAAPRAAGAEVLVDGRAAGRVPLRIRVAARRTPRCAGGRSTQSGAGARRRQRDRGLGGLWAALTLPGPPSHPAAAVTTSQPAPPQPAGMRSQAARFLGVGVVNTLVSFGVFRGLLAALPRVPGSAALAQTVATALAMCCSYALNRAWTFRSGARRGPELARFVASQGALLALSSVLLEIAIHGYHLPPTASWLAVTAGMTVLNYLGQRYWVFASRRDPPSQ
jgi:putative flippase GtrA